MPSLQQSILPIRQSRTVCIIPHPGHNSSPATPFDQEPPADILPFPRHKRTHDREDGGEGSFNLSGEDEEEYSGEDHLGSLEEASPGSENAYVTSSLNAVASSVSVNTAPTQTFNSLQTLSMPMTLSQPTAINASGMM